MLYEPGIICDKCVLISQSLSRRDYGPEQYNEFFRYLMNKPDLPIITEKTFDDCEIQIKKIPESRVPEKEKYRAITKLHSIKEKIAPKRIDEKKVKEKFSMIDTLINNIHLNKGYRPQDLNIHGPQEEDRVLVAEGLAIADQYLIDTMYLATYDKDFLRKHIKRGLKSIGIIPMGPFEILETI